MPRKRTTALSLTRINGGQSYAQAPSIKAERKRRRVRLPKTVDKIFWHINQSISVLLPCEKAIYLPRIDVEKWWCAQVLCEYLCSYPDLYTENVRIARLALVRTVPPEGGGAAKPLVRAICHCRTRFRGACAEEWRVQALRHGACLRRIRRAQGIQPLGNREDISPRMRTASGQRGAIATTLALSKDARLFF